MTRRSALRMLGVVFALPLACGDASAESASGWEDATTSVPAGVPRYCSWCGSRSTWHDLTSPRWGCLNCGRHTTDDGKRTPAPLFGGPLAVRMLP